MVQIERYYILQFKINPITSIRFKQAKYQSTKPETLSTNQQKLSTKVGTRGNPPWALILTLTLTLTNPNPNPYPIPYPNRPSVDCIH